MRSLAREELRGAEHLSTSRLIAFHRGEIPPAETTAVTEHLSLCQECSALMLEVAEFFADDEEEDVAPLAAPPQRSPVRSLVFAYGIAAACAAISIGLAVFRETAPPMRPQTNPGLYDLTSSGSDRAETADATPIRFRTSGDSAFLILNPEVAPDALRYGVRIRNADGAVVWRSEDLVLQSPGGFHLSLPAGALPSGRYSLKLYGISEGRETPLGTYLIAIEK